MLLAPACLLWLLLGVALVEWPAMRAEQALQLVLAKPLLYVAAGSMGFCVNLLGYLIIQKSSSVTLKACRPQPILDIKSATMTLTPRAI